MTQWGSGPVILVFADTEEGATAASRSVKAADGRIAASVDIDTATQRLDDQVAVDLVLLDIVDDHGPTLDALLDRLAEGAGRRDYMVLIVIPPVLVDIVSARAEGEGIDVLVGRDSLDETLTDRLTRPALQLHEDDDDEPMVRRRFPKDDFEQGEPAAAMLHEDGDGYSTSPTTADASAIRDIIRARRLREDLFGAGLFADPAWDILLDLMAARIEGRSVAVSSLCIAAAVPATTALRWIKQLTDAGLLRRVADPDDGRRVFIELTDNAATAMATYFAAVPSGARG